jgi:hypothetical protein
LNWKEHNRERLCSFFFESKLVIIKFERPLEGIVSQNGFLDFNHMSTSPAHDEKMAKLTFSSVYPLYLSKVEKKGRSEKELQQVIEWLTGFDVSKQQELIDQKVTFVTFFELAALNPNAELITGMICGYRIEEIQTKLTREVRYLDKLVDELAKGKKMEKILRGSIN